MTGGWQKAKVLKGKCGPLRVLDWAFFTQQVARRSPLKNPRSKNSPGWSCLNPLDIAHLPTPAGGPRIRAPVCGQPLGRKVPRSGHQQMVEDFLPAFLVAYDPGVFQH